MKIALISVTKSDSVFPTFLFSCTADLNQLSSDMQQPKNLELPFCTALKMKKALEEASPQSNQFTCFINCLIPHLQKMLASDWLFSSAFFYNTRAIN